MPPDCNGTIGTNHYLQTINLTYTVYNRSGSLVGGPFALNSFFTGVTGANCNDGDPLILYDEQAHRWLATEFSICNANDYMLIAVSTTDDPTGTWNRWSFDVDDIPDYPKFGVWRDGYYMATNNTSGKDVYVFERSVMLAGGQSPQMVGFDNPNRPASGFHCIMPLDNDGLFAPSGTPGQFITINDNVWGGTDALWIYELAVNWTTPASSTFARTQVVTVPSFDSNFGVSWDNITQPGTSQKLDAINTILMHRAQYQNFGSYQTIVCNHTVDVDGTDHGGVRWYELRNTGSTWTLRQAGTFAPDARSRWLGGISMNKKNEIALAYSISSSTEYPGIRFTGQTAAEYATASGVFDIDETNIKTGAGSQTTINRWGDYAGMCVDPNDSTTFWFTTEYCKAGGNLGTQITSFKFPDLAAPPYADFVGAPTTIPEGGMVNFTDVSANLPSSWSWSFPGGTPTTSNLQNPTGIVYSSSGLYNVTLTATNSNGSDIETKTNYINVAEQGCASIFFSQNFDGVIAPAIPIGWTTAGSCAVDFYTGDATDANAGGYWPVPEHGQFAMSNDDVYNCAKTIDYLTLPTQNFTGKTGMELTFSASNSGDYGGTSTVELNINGGGWNSIYTIANANNWRSFTIPLTGTDNIANVGIRFHYNDGGAWATGLAIDDVSLSAKHSNNNVLASTSTITYYTSIPYIQAPVLTFGGNIKNGGFNNQTGTHLDVSVAGAKTFNGSSPSSTLNVNVESPFTLSSTFTPSNIGTYDVTYTAHQDSTDCTPLDNVTTIANAIVVSDTVYARDDNNAAYQLSGASYGFTNLNYKCAVSFTVLATDNAKSISIGIGPGAVAGKTIRGRIWNNNAGTPNAYVASTAVYTLTTDDLYSWLTLQLSSVTSLAPGKYYVGFEADTNVLVLAGMGLPIEAGSLWINDNTTWYSDADGVAEIYFCRLNFANNPPPYNLALEGVGFTDYSLTPVSQVVPIEFLGLLGNNGDNNQTNVKFKVTVSGSGSFIDSSSTLATLLPTVDSLVSTANTYQPSIGNYNVQFQALSTQTPLDNAPQDNSMNAVFGVTDTVYARDYGTFDGGGRYNVGVSYELGNAFEIVSVKRPNSVSVYLHPVTDAGSVIKAFLYDGTLTNRIDSSASHTILAGEINSGFLTLPLIHRTSLVPGWYYAVVMQVNTGDTVAIADGSDFYQSAGASIFRDTAYTGTWYSLDLAPFIRLNLDICPGLAISPSYNVCSSGPAELVASGYIDYTWAPATGLNTTVGDTVIA